MKKTALIAVLLAIASSASSQNLTLEEALETAMQSRPALKAAKLRLDGSRRNSTGLGAYPATILELGGSSTPGAGGDDDLVLTQPLDLFGRTSSLRRLASATVRSAEFEYQNLVLDIQTEIIVAFAEAFAAGRMEESAKAILKTATQLHQTVKRNVDEGTSPAVQLLRSQIELDRVTQELEIAQAKAVASLENLASVVGIDVAPALAPEGINLTALHNPSALQHPFLSSIRMSALVARAESAYLSRTNLPELELQARRSGWADDSTVYGLRLQLTWPLYDHGKAKAESGAASALAMAIEQDLLDSTRIITGELKAINAQLVAARRQVTAYTSINTSVHGLVEKTTRAYSEGVGTFIDVLEATRTLRESELDVINAELELSTLIARQFRAAGHLLEIWK